MEVTLERPLVDLYMLARDSAYTSLKPKSKEPVGSAWQNKPKSPELVLHEHRQLGNNIGLINGSLSGIVDVDLDCEEAVVLACNLRSDGGLHVQQQLYEASCSFRTMVRSLGLRMLHD